MPTLVASLSPYPPFSSSRLLVLPQITESRNLEVTWMKKGRYSVTHGISTRSKLQIVGSQKQPEKNLNKEDTDEMFDELFEKYGNVVYRRNDQKTPSAEADADAESLSFAVSLAKVANDVKAADIQVLFVKPLVYWTRFFVIATAFSRPQIDALGSRIRDMAEKEYKRVPSGDTKPNSWTLLDFGDVVVHIFLPEQRAFYNLEEFYGNATSIELPFDSKSTFRN